MKKGKYLETIGNCAIKLNVNEEVSTFAHATYNKDQILLQVIKKRQFPKSIIKLAERIISKEEYKNNWKGHRSKLVAFECMNEIV